MAAGGALGGAPRLLGQVERVGRALRRAQGRQQPLTGLLAGRRRVADQHLCAALVDASGAVCTKLAAAIIMIMLEARISNLTSVVRALQWVALAIAPKASRLAPASAKIDGQATGGRAERLDPTRS